MKFSTKAKIASWYLRNQGIIGIAAIALALAISFMK
jgi:hypothetical protein